MSRSKCKPTQPAWRWFPPAAAKTRSVCPRHQQQAGSRQLPWILHTHGGPQRSRRLRLLASVAVFVCAAAALAHPLAGQPQAEPTSLGERIRAANFWEQFARDGETRYFMRAQPSQSEATLAAELGIPPQARDGSPIALGQPLEFRTPQDMRLVTAFGPGIRNPRVEDGVLQFSTAGPDAYLMCGNLNGQHPRGGVRPFGTAYEFERAGGWYRNTFYGVPCAMYLRMRQSLPESRWRLITGPIEEWNELCRTPPAPGQTTNEFTMQGSDWQTVIIAYSDKVRDLQGQPDMLRPFGSFALYCLTPENQVQLAWIRICDGMQHVYARRTLELPAPPVEARLAISVWDSEIYVNGRLAADRAFPLHGARMGYREVDLLPHLQQGRNVLAIHEYCAYGELNVTGRIVCADGTFVPLHSWLPLRQQQGQWVANPQVSHYLLESPYAGPWKTAHLTFDEAARGCFMEPAFDDRDWGTLTGLTTSGVQPVATPYAGLLHVVLPPPEQVLAAGRSADVPRRHPIFSPREPVRLEIQALRVRPAWPAYSLQYRLHYQETGAELSSGTLRLDEGGRALFFREGLKQGPYRLSLKLLQDGETVDQRQFEFLVVGPIAQPLVSDDNVLAGIDWETVYEIDCTAEPPQEGYAALQGWEGQGAAGIARVAESAAGRFRETGEGNADCFSYRVQIADPRRPHVLEVVYPDDRQRVSSFYYTEARTLADGTRVGVNRCSLAAVSGWRRPTQRMRTVYGIFWPTQAEGTVDVFTTRYSSQHPAAPAAAARIRIHALRGELPRLRLHDFPGQFKPLGVHTERGGYVLWPTYYAGRNHPGEAAFNHLHERPDFYADWYSVCTNFTRHLRFHGQNFYIAGQHMYGGTNFPSRFNDNDNGSGGEAIHCQQDWGGILASVLGENECGFVSSFEFINNSAIIAQGAPSPAQLAAGIPTLLAVDHRGRAAPYGSGIYLPSPLPSYAHPEVEALVLAEVDEVIALYREYPGWKGINFLLNSLCGPSYGELGRDPLKMGYEDVAIERFERETGIALPVDRRDPCRFSKRYAWIHEHPSVLDRWIEWRCQVLLEIFRKIRDRLLAVRPDCRLYLNIAYPYGPREERMRYVQDREALRRYIMRWGWDPAAYEHEPGMVVYTMVAADAEKRRWMAGEYAEMPLERAAALDETYLGLFAGNGRGGLDLHCIFTENWPLARPGTWLWSANGAWVAYHWPPQDAFADYWTNALVRAHPAIMAYNWHDSNLDSRLEPALRRFARTWRALPNGRYERLRGSGRDQNLLLQRCREHPQYFLAANPWPWTATVELRIVADRVTDLHTDTEAASGPEACWRFVLPPFGTQAFRAEGAGGGPIAAAVEISPHDVDALRAELEAEERLARQYLEQQHPDAQAFAERVAQLRRRFDQQDFAGVHDELRAGYQYHLLRRRLAP